MDFKLEITIYDWIKNMWNMMEFHVEIQRTYYNKWKMSVRI